MSIAGSDKKLLLDTRFIEDDIWVHTINGQEERWGAVRKIGEGRFGEVSEVWKRNGNGVRAVKKVKFGHLSDPARMTPGKVESLMKLEEHSSYFVQLFGWWESETHLYLTMEYMEYGNLAKYIDDQESISERDIKSIAAQLLEGLEIMHDQGLIHRDLKAKNVLIARLKPVHVKIADFGLSRKVEDHSKDAHKSHLGPTGSAEPLEPEFTGTRVYIAPELDSKCYDFKADIWSVGILTRQMFAKGSPSDLAQSFPDRLLTVDLARRPSAREALQHVWLLRKPHPHLFYGVNLKPEETWSWSSLWSSNSSEWLAESAPYLDLEYCDSFGNSALHAAVLEVNRDLVVALLGLGAYIGAQDLQGFTVLHIAARLSHEQEGFHDLVDQLLQHGANMEARDSNGSTPLHRAAREGNLELARALLRNEPKADIEAKDNSGCTPLHVAAINGESDMVGFLLEWEADIEAKDSEGRTVLHEACRLFGPDQSSLISLLLGRGAKFDAMDEAGSKPAYYSLNHGVTPATILHEHGADIHAKNKEGLALLHLAARAGNTELVLYALADPHLPDEMKSTALTQAIDAGQLKTSKVLLNACEWSQDEKNGFLGRAIQKYHEGIIELLFETQPPPNIEAKHENMTPLLSAVKLGLLDTVKLLVKNGADVKAIDEEGNTALHLAVDYGWPETLQFLLDLQLVDIEAQDKVGLKVVHKAAMSGSIYMMKNLMRHSADILSTNGDGNTVLHVAAYRGHMALVNEIVANTDFNQPSPMIHSTNNSGATPLHTAASSGCIKMVKNLLSLGASIEVLDHKGYLPLHHAVIRAHEEVVRLLARRNADGASLVSQWSIAKELARSYRYRELESLIDEFLTNTE